MGNSLKKIVNEAIKQEKEHKLAAEEDRKLAERNIMKSFETYFQLEKHFGGFLQALGYAHEKSNKRSELSLRVQGDEETPTILLKINTTSADGYIGFKPGKKVGTYSLLIDEKFFGTNLTDKIAHRVKALDSDFTVEEAKKALAVVLASNPEKFQRHAKFALSWGRFMKQSMPIVWNEKYGCKNSELKPYYKSTYGHGVKVKGFGHG